LLGADARVFVAGHRGLVGSAIHRKLAAMGCTHVLTRDRRELDLTDRESVRRFFAAHRPEFVFLCAAKVGGIAANMAEPVAFLLDNLAIQNNVLEACAAFGVTKTIFLGSSCVYPREAPQPIQESSFMTGPLEPTNESYAVAKVAGVRLAAALHEQYGLSILCPMPCNVYGPNDHFEFERSHVVSALVRRFVEATDAGASEVVLWGTGSARREFMHADDLADACLFLIERYDSPELINVGTGVDQTIRELAELIAAAVGYRGRMTWDTSKPDGMPRKLLDVSRINALGWRSSIDLASGLPGVIDECRRYLAGAAAGAPAR
jgi:GDP-L-fucose synthase